MAQKEQKLQKEILRLSEENMEMRFEVEEARRDIPRLKVGFLGISKAFKSVFRNRRGSKTCKVTWSFLKQKKSNSAEGAPTHRRLPISNGLEIEVSLRFLGRMLIIADWRKWKKR